MHNKMTSDTEYIKTHRTLCAVQHSITQTPMHVAQGNLTFLKELLILDQYIVFPSQVALRRDFAEMCMLGSRFRIRLTARKSLP